MALMGVREYGRHRGVSHVAVIKAIEAGRITATGSGRDRKIDSDQADRDWVTNTDASRVAVHATAPIVAPAGATDQAATAAATAAPAAGTASTPANAAPATAPADLVDAAAQGGHEPASAASPAPKSEYQEHRTLREKYSGLKEQLEYEQLQGRLVDVNEAARLAFTTFRALRDATKNLSPRLKDQLAAETDPYKVEHLLDAEIDAVFAGVDVRKLFAEDDDDEAQG